MAQTHRAARSQRPGPEEGSEGKSKQKARITAYTLDKILPPDL